MVRVALIDDGVNAIELPGGAIVKHYEALSQDTITAYTPSLSLLGKSSHGTFCADVLNYYIDSYELISIKIMERGTLGDINKLLLACEWCGNNGIDIINLSIGSSSYYDFKSINNTIQGLINKGVIVIAAGNNNNTLTFPAAMEDVISVRYWDSLPADSFLYIKNPPEGIDIAAKTILPHTGNNSFTTPYITAIACGFMNRGYTDLDSIRDCFSQHSYLKSGYCPEREAASAKTNLGEIPIICVIDTDTKLLRLLVEGIRNKGYNCIGLANTLPNDYINGYFNWQCYKTGATHLTTDIISYYEHFTNCDLLIFQTPNSSSSVIKDLINENQIDVVVDPLSKVEDSVFQSHDIIRINHNGIDAVLSEIIILFGLTC